MVLSEEIHGSGSLDSVQSFEKICHNLIFDYFHINTEIVEKLNKAAKSVNDSINLESYMVVLKIWQDTFTFLVDHAFPELTIDELFEPASKEDMKEALESDWLKRFDFVETACRYILYNSEIDFYDELVNVHTTKFIEDLGAGEILERFSGRWAVSIDGEVSHRSVENDFLLCERAIITDTLNTVQFQGRDEQWWIGPRDVKPLTLAFPFDMVTDMIAPSDVRYRSGLRTADYDARLTLESTPEADRQSRLPLILNRLGVLQHMVIFDELDLNLSVEPNNGETEVEFSKRLSRILDLLEDKSKAYNEDIGYSIALVVEGPRVDVRKRVVGHVLRGI